MTKIRGKPKTVSDGFIFCTQLPVDLQMGDIVMLSDNIARKVIADGTTIVYSLDDEHEVVSVSYNSCDMDTGGIRGLKYFSVKTCEHIFGEMPNIIAYKRVTSK